MNAFGVEPFVVNDLKFTVLFQTGVFVIDDIHQFLVIADDTEFTGRDINLVENDVVEIQFLDFAGQRYFAPDKVFVAS